MRTWFEREELLHLPNGTVLFVCGAGGKTTLIHEIAQRVRERGSSVLITTTTHMLKEDGLRTTEEQIRKQLLKEGCAFAGKQDPKHEHKICSPSMEELKSWIGLADVTLIEADGSRMLPFKAPYPWEPVITEEATAIAVLYGAVAEGHPIGEISYNIEEVGRVLEGFSQLPEAERSGGITEPDFRDICLTREMAEYVLTETYLKPLRERFPKAETGLLRVVY